jgi:hypothetical protein
MSGFYILDVPEFASILREVVRSGRGRAHPMVAGYTFVEFDGEIELLRRSTDVTEAVWFGCLTAGLDGKIAEFTSERLRLVATNEPILPSV